jgi:hypothetical protein
MQNWNFCFVFLHCDTLPIDPYMAPGFGKNKNGCHAQEAEAVSNAATNLPFLLPIGLKEIMIQACHDKMCLPGVPFLLIPNVF